MHPVQVYDEGDRVILAEPNGSAALRSEMTEAMSRAGRLVVLYQGDNAEMEFRYVVLGEARRVFDPLGFPDGQRGGPLPEEVGLVFGLPEDDPEHDPFAEAVVLAERLTGPALTDDLILDQPRPTVLAPSRY